MSKFLSLYLPAAGGTALVLGLGYGLATRTYQDQTVASLETQLAQKEATVANAVATKQAIENEIAQVMAERDELAVRAAQGGGLTEPAPVIEAALNLGREALPEEIAAWDVDVLPDGRGLPEGSGDVWTGEEVFVAQCASCHGDFAEGAGNWPVLAGGFGTLADEDPVKTVGSYWPHLSTTWDYINRSMPFGNAGTLSADDTYAIVAYILYSNDLVDDNFELSHENFTEVELPNAGGFIIDDRPETEYAVLSAEPCMSDCKDGVEITMRASVVDVTPEETMEEEASAAHSMTTEMAGAESEVVQASADPALIEAGKGVFRQCSSCHQVGADARNASGPMLNGIVGRDIGTVDGFRYSTVLADAGEAGQTWDDATLKAFLMDPRGAMPGTKMAFRGLRSEDDYASLVAYLQSADGQ